MRVCPTSSVRADIWRLQVRNRHASTEHKRPTEREFSLRSVVTTYTMPSFFLNLWKMATQRITFSPHPLRLFKSHLRPCVSGGQSSLMGLRANSTFAEKSATREDPVNSNRTKIQATYSRRPGEAGRMTQVPQAYKNSHQRRPYLFQF